MSNSNGTINLTRVINIILTIILLGIIVFGWWYIKGFNAIDYFSSLRQSEKLRVNYLFTLYQSPDLKLKRPSYTQVYNKLIYVADTENGRIVVFDYNGKFLKNIYGTGVGKLISPVSLTFVDSDLYVSDSKVGKIFIFDKTGTFKGFFNTEAEIIPGGIFYKNSLLYVLDVKTMVVRIYNKTGKQIKIFGSRGTNSGQLYFPYSIHVNERTEIFIADSNNNRIQVFNFEGKVIKTITGKNSIGTNEPLSVPRGIAFDKFGNLYTADGLNHQVAIFNPAGDTVGYIKEGEPVDPAIGLQDQLRLPTEVFIDDEQRLYITEFSNSRILVYDLK